MALWEDAYQAQMDLWAFYNTPKGARFIEGWSQDKVGKDVWPEISVGRLLDTEKRLTFHAEPVALSRDMLALVRAAEPTFLQEPLQPTDLLTPHGFLWLPEPLVSDDIWGKPVSVRAIGWMPYLHESRLRSLVEQAGFDNARRTFNDPDAGEAVLSPAYGLWRTLNGDVEHANGITLSLYTHRADPDWYNEEFLRQHGRETFLRVIPTLSLHHTMNWGFGRDYTAPPPGGFEGFHDGEYYAEAGVTLEDAVQQNIRMLRPIQTIFRLLLQTLADKTEVRPSRGTRRRAERMSFPEKYVTVVNLRRPRRPSGDEEKADVPWTHRWIVGGHWRNQWYPSLSAHRQIWISPYVKGPDDLPLVPRTLRAFQLVR